MNTLIQRKRICFVILLWGASANSAPGQTFTTLVTFNYTNGAGPLAGLVQGADGYLYGTTTYGGTLYAL